MFSGYFSYSRLLRRHYTVESTSTPNDEPFSAEYSKSQTHLCLRKLTKIAIAHHSLVNQIEARRYLVWAFQEYRDSRHKVPNFPVSFHTFRSPSLKPVMKALGQMLKHKRWLTRCPLQMAVGALNQLLLHLQKHCAIASFRNHLAASTP